MAAVSRRFGTSVTASWSRSRVLEVGWALFSAGNLAVMAVLAGHDGGTIPFHFIWISLTVLYGFTVWRTWPTVLVLTAVMAATAGMIMLEVVEGPTRPDELSEVPLMGAVFVAMAWHAHRRVAAERQLIEMAEREQEFIHDSSHHLKTPIAIARGYAELVRSGGLTERQRKDVDLLLVELDRSTRIVDGLLLFTSSQSHSIERRRVDLGELLEVVTDRWSAAVSRRFTVDVGCAGVVPGDAERLLLAFDALLENAVEATDPGGAIRVAASTEGDRCVLEVSDDGRGIPAEELPHVFERFWTRSRDRTRTHTGLGLATVKSIVEVHDGTVDVQSGRGGTVFRIELGPLLGAAEPLLPAQVEKPAAAALS